MPEYEPLIGPSAYDRERILTPGQVQLADGSPLYHALLPNPDALVASKDEMQKAKEELAGIISADLDAVLSCHGKTAEEAREILRSVPV